MSSKVQQKKTDVSVKLAMYVYVSARHYVTVKHYDFNNIASRE